MAHGPEDRAQRGVKTKRLMPDAPKIIAQGAMTQGPEDRARRGVKTKRLMPDAPKFIAPWAMTLPLGELRPLAGLLEPSLLALLDPRVASQEAPALELAA